MSNDQQTRVLFIGEAITLSHMVRPAVLASTLDPSRYEVSFACDPRYQALFGRSFSLPFIPLKSRMSEKSMERISMFQDRFYDVETIETYVVEDLALIDAHRPDVIVGDMRQSLIISTRLRRVPFVNIMNCYWHPATTTPYESPVNPVGGIVGEPIGTMLFNLVMNAGLFLSTVDMGVSCLRHRVPIAGIDFKQVFSHGDFIAFPDIPEWSPLASTPPNAAFVGPCLWSPEMPPPPWWDRLPADRLVVYVNLGSSGQPRLLRTIVDALADLPLTLIVATASRAQLTDLRENVFIADFLDGREAARRSRLVICNGGSTAGPQALATGRPILGITSNIDQVAFMRRIEALGAGEMITEATLDAYKLRERVHRLLFHESYARAASDLAAAIARLDTAQAFNGLMDRVTASLRCGPRDRYRATAATLMAEGVPC